MSWGFFNNKLTDMSCRGLFFQEIFWLIIPLYSLYFLGRSFNYLIFLMKVFKLVWGKTSRKWEWLCILLKTKLGNYIFLLLKFYVKYTDTTSLTRLFLSIFLKKALEHVFLLFWNEVFLKCLDFFSQCQQSFWYHLFLFITYIAVDSNKIKK